MVTFEDESHLVLTRKPGEAIVIDGPAVIEFISDRGGRTRVGIRASRKTRILRDELVGKEHPRRPAA